MVKDFHLDLILPDGMFFSGSVREIIVPAAEGEMTILAHHQPFVIMLLPGILTLKFSSGVEKIYLVFDGLLDILLERTSLLVEDIIEIDHARDYDFEAKKQAAQQSLSNALDDSARMRSLDFLNRLIVLENRVRNSSSKLSSGLQ